MVPSFVDWSYHSQIIALLKHCKFSGEMMFCTKLYNDCILKFSACTTMSGFHNWVTYIATILL